MAGDNIVRGFYGQNEDAPDLTAEERELAAALIRKMLDRHGLAGTKHWLLGVHQGLIGANFPVPYSGKF